MIVRSTETIMPLRPLCLALVFALVAVGFASRAGAMTFETIDGSGPCASRGCVFASGAIDEHSGPAFAAFLKTSKVGPGGLVILDSPGGDLLQSLVLGNEIRAAGLATTVQGYDRRTGRLQAGACASACAYAFLGGVERTVSEGSRIGVHQIYSTDGTWNLSAQDGMELMSLVAIHLDRLCGNLDLLIPTLKTHPGDMHWLSPGELARYAVVTAPPAGRLGLGAP
jgi:hypothetical protein